MRGVVVSDSSALIALERIGQIDLLSRLLAKVIIPPAVAQEVGPSVAGLTWIEERHLSRPIDRGVAAASLGPGESEVISLALELRPYRVILDDQPARGLAKRLGLPVIGLLGLLRAAKRQSVVTEVRPILDALIVSGFRLSPDLYEPLLASVGESPA
jgi:hypothetical protein